MMDPIELVEAWMHEAGETVIGEVVQRTTHTFMAFGKEGDIFRFGVMKEDGAWEIKWVTRNGALTSLSAL